MSYTTLLFDLDDTLLDFGANERRSLAQLFQHHGYPYSDELLLVYNTVNKQLWAEYEDGSITLDVVLKTRFAETLLRLGEAVDGTAWERKYRELLGSGEQLLVEGALEVCQRLSLTHRLFVITNGINHTQIQRLKQAGLYSFFEDIFDSQSIGYQKPSIHFFEHVSRHIRDFKKSEALIIGDSLNTDIRGGIQFGVDTCWLNRHSLRNPDDITSTYTITSLEELFAFC